MFFSRANDHAVFFMIISKETILKRVENIEELLPRHPIECVTRLQKLKNIKEMFPGNCQWFVSQQQYHKHRNIYSLKRI